MAFRVLERFHSSGIQGRNQVHFFRCQVDFSNGPALSCVIYKAHNHPSGNTKPSSADLSMTKQIKKGGALLEIKVLDHVILTVDGHSSMADEGLM